MRVVRRCAWPLHVDLQGSSSYLSFSCHHYTLEKTICQPLNRCKKSNNNLAMAKVWLWLLKRGGRSIEVSSTAVIKNSGLWKMAANKKRWLLLHVFYRWPLNKGRNIPSSFFKHLARLTSC